MTTRTINKTHTVPFPVKPMLLESAEEPFDSSDHIFEWKVDGVRCIMFYDHGAVRLQSKTGKEFTGKFPELLNPPVNASEAVLDGEVTVLTAGKPDFESVMERYLAREQAIHRLMLTKPAVYIVWDILWLNGERLTGKPLLRRKELLAMTVEDTDTVRKIDWIETDGRAMWEAVIHQGLEGMVSKNINSRYSTGKRSPAWVKVKNYTEAEVNIFGYDPKDGSALVGLGNIVQGHAVGINRADKEIIRKLLDKFGQEGKNGVIWLPMGAKARVKFTTLSPRGNMRDCCWVGF